MVSSFTWIIIERQLGQLAIAKREDYAYVAREAADLSITHGSTGNWNLKLKFQIVIHIPILTWMAHNHPAWLDGWWEEDRTSAVASKLGSLMQVMSIISCFMCLVGFFFLGNLVFFFFLLLTISMVFSLVRDSTMYAIFVHFVLLHTD